MSTLINIDASARGGGGQTLRIIIGLAAATGKGVNVTNIRYRRSNPEGGYGGMKTADVLNVEWLANACQARVEGMKYGSTTLKFEPGADLTRVKPEWTIRTCPSGQRYRHHTVDLEDGGVSIFLQAVLPFLLLKTGPTRSHHWTRSSDEPLHLTLLGGTHFSGCATIDFVERVIAPNLATLFPANPQDRPLIQLYRGSQGHDDDLRIKQEWSGQNKRGGRATFVIWPLANSESLQAFTVPKLTVSAWPGKHSLSIDLIGPQFPRSPSYFEDAASQVVPLYFPNASISSITSQRGSSQNDNSLYVLLVLITPDGYRIGTSEFYYLYGALPTLREKAEQVLHKACTELITEVVSGGLRFDGQMLDQLPVFQGLAAGQSVIQPDGEDANRMAILNVMSNGAVSAWCWRQQITRMRDMLGLSVEGDLGSIEGTPDAEVQNADTCRDATPTTTNTKNNTQLTQAPAKTERKTRARKPADTSHVLSAREAVSTLLGATFDDLGNCEGVKVEAREI